MQQNMSLEARRCRLLKMLVQLHGPAVGSPKEIEHDIALIAQHIAKHFNWNSDQAQIHVEHFITDQLIPAYAAYVKNNRRPHGQAEIAFHSDRIVEMETIASAYLLHKLDQDAWGHTTVNQADLKDRDTREKIGTFIYLPNRGEYSNFIDDLFKDVKDFRRRSTYRALAHVRAN